MKKLITILCATLISVGVFAQAETEAGTFLISMGTDGVNFSSTSGTSAEGMGGWYGSNGTGSLTELEFDDKYDKYNVSSFGLKTDVGYFVTDGFMIGLGFGYASTTTTVEYNSDYEDLYGDDDWDESSSSFTLSPMVRYYIGESGLWSQLAYHLKSESKDNSWGSYDDTEFPKTNTLSIRAGYMVSLNDYVSLNPFLGYNMSTVTTKDGGADKDGEEMDSKIKAGGIQFGVELNVHLGN
jgi:hypothetical protein